VYGKKQAAAKKTQDKKAVSKEVSVKKNLAGAQKTGAVTVQQPAQLPVKKAKKVDIANK